MVPKKIKTRIVSKSSYRSYIRKAEEFHETMYQAEDRSNWNKDIFSQKKCEKGAFCHSNSIVCQIWDKERPSRRKIFITRPIMIKPNAIERSDE